jgi:hypothetical protein
MQNQINSAEQEGRWEDIRKWGRSLKEIGKERF